MTRLHADPVAVRRRDEEPAEFLWRDRLYVVREVLARWTESGAWWRTPAAAALLSGDPAPGGDADPTAPVPELATAPLQPSPRWGQRAWGEPAPDVGAYAGPVGIDDGEREHWRVEAAAGRSAPAGVYDLCLHRSSGDWSLARVLD